ncbi:MAG: XisH family protein [Cyanobacteria bacterium]|nr:XisH family protein [Cyanobacteriota bacterium]
MPSRDSIHYPVKSSLQRSGWQITADPYVISYGESFLFVDLSAESVIIGAEQENIRIAIEIKALRGRSIMAELEQAIGQYVLYQILLAEVDPDRKLYLAITTQIYKELFQEPIGQLVLKALPLKLVVVDITSQEITQWIPQPFGKPSNK